MAYITRDDGERFVIPSYRDVLTTKRASQLKKDITQLSQNYGEYITLQRKAPGQYEVAFSPDSGYLLGETVWHFLKRPNEMIYCEAIPNTTEAILVIVKNGGVYLDGRFPLESIPEELVIFLTQQNNFDIYVYGDVPISQTPEEGKFSFDPSAVKSFTVLQDPVFNTLPRLKIYQLQLADQVLKSQGIGVLPIKQIIFAALFIVAAWYLWVTFLAAPPPPPKTVQQVDPFQGFYNSLATPAPDDELHAFIDTIRMFYALPGWVVNKIDYSHGSLVAQVRSNGGTIADLQAWAAQNEVTADMRQDGFYLTLLLHFENRPKPRKIYQLKQVFAILLDRIATVYPGNHMQLVASTPRGPYADYTFNVALAEVSPILLKLISDQFKGLPLVLSSISVTILNGAMSGTINLDAVGT